MPSSNSIEMEYLEPVDYLLNLCIMKNIEIKKKTIIVATSTSVAITIDFIVSISSSSIAIGNKKNMN